MLPAVVRLALNERTPVSSLQLDVWQSTDLRIDFALFKEGSTTELDVDYGNITGVRLEIHRGPTGGSGLLIAPDPVDALDLDGSLTVEEWEAGTGQHGTIEIPAASLAQEVSYGQLKCWYTIFSTTTDGGKIVHAAGPFNIHRNRSTGAGTPPAPPELYLTANETIDLVQGVGGAGTRVFVNDVARNSAAANFLGQLGYQSDIGLNYVSRSTTAGDWVITGDVRYVRTEAELVAAVAQGGKIGVVGTITLTSNLVLSVPYTELFGVLTSAGKGTLSRAYALGFTSTVIDLQTHHVRIRDLVLDANHDKTETATDTFCVRLSSSPSHDLSYCHIVDCELKNAQYVIWRARTFTSYTSEYIAVERCFIHSFTRFGIYLQYNTPWLNVIRCKIWGRLEGATHAVLGNAIWVGNNANHSSFIRNDLAYCGRHGIEYWNSQDDAATLEGNENGLIAENYIHDMLGYSTGSFSYDQQASFGISAFGAGGGLLRIVNNITRNCYIGIELYNDSVNDSRILCAFNQASEIYNQCISVNACYNTDVCHNMLGPCEPNLGHGVQVIKGAYNVNLMNNTFINAGVYPVLVNGANWQINSITPQVGTGYAVIVFEGDAYISYNGKWLYFTELGGLTALNNKFVKVLSVTSQVETPASSGHWIITAVLPIDISAMPAWTPGTGRVRERFNNLRIEGNTFERTIDYSGIISFAPCLWFIGVQNLVYKNNVIFYDGDLLDHADAIVSHWGDIHVGSFGEAPVQARNNDKYIYAGSNLRLLREPCIEA